MHIPLLQDILIVLGFSVVIVFALQRVKLPSIIGFLITGVIIGPNGLSLINAVEQVEILSEVGVILLLFVIGMELSLAQLAAIKKTVFIGGFLQVGITVIVAGLFYYSMGHSWNEAVFIGFLFSMSSTAIVLKTLQDKQDISSPHARNALAILIFQDIIVVPMMLITPMLAGNDSSNLTESIVWLLLKSVVIIVLMLFSARYIIPRLLHAVAKTNSKELFLLVTITLCFAVAFITSEIGLSLALGAFIAGLIISESEYSYQATSIILPFRELFTSFFFVSVGMLLDLSFFLSNIHIILLLVLVVFILKSAIAGIAVASLKYPTRTVLLTGLSLFQVGEFAFILSKVGIQYNLLTAQSNQYFLSVSIVSMLLTPFVIIFSEQIVNQFRRFLKKTGYSQLVSEKDKEGHSPILYNNHLVIIGFGMNGSNLAKAAAASKIPYVVIEMNAETVRRERGKGLPILFGDATQDYILKKVHLADARAAVIAISDNVATKSIIKNIRQLSKSIYLVVRTRYVKETPELFALGADEVIPEEFETSVKIFTNILQNFLVPEDNISELVDKVRADNYQLFKGELKLPKTYRPDDIAEFNITSLRLNTDSNTFIGKPLREMNLRANFGINILVIKRSEKLIESIQPNEVLKRGDVLYVQGTPTNIEKFHKLIR